MSDQQYYRILLDDYSATSFTSFDKAYFGTMSDLEGWIKAIEVEKCFAERFSSLTKTFRAYQSGQHNITHNVAYQEVRFLDKVTLLYRESYTAEKLAWEHLNTWQWPYFISTPISDWRIIPSGKGNEVVLYHKNTLGDKKTGPVPRYHLQWVSQNTISGYLEYISDHDLYRNMHPLYPVQSKKNSPPPMKGTKRYRKEQKRAAKKARRQSIAHVLTLIENLDTQARVARSM